MRIAKLILSTLFTICILGLVAGGVLYFHLKSSLPSVESQKTVELQQPMQIYTADGKLIGEVGEQRRIPVKLENVPQRLQDAFLATEDSRFMTIMVLTLSVLLVRFCCCQQWWCISRGKHHYTTACT